MKILVAACVNVCCVLMIVKAQYDSNDFDVFIPKHMDCLLPIEYGLCSSFDTYYAWDPLKSNCVSFTYSGCGGNENRFSSKKLCEQKCVRGDDFESDESDDYFWDWFLFW